LLVWNHSLVRCMQASPYNYKDKVVLFGDAAHACVPFYGQGLNAVSIFDFTFPVRDRCRLFNLACLFKTNTLLKVLLRVPQRFQ